MEKTWFDFLKGRYKSERDGRIGKKKIEEQRGGKR